MLQLIPVDVLEVKENIVTFAWEPVGCKFAIVHGESPRVGVSVYELTYGAPTPVSLLKTFEKMPANSLHWSPRGRFLVVAGLNLPGDNLGGGLIENYPLYQKKKSSREAEGSMHLSTLG